MTCTRYASSAHETAPARWLLSDSPPGPRLPRIRSRFAVLSGPVISTEANWIDALDKRQALSDLRDDLLAKAERARQMRQSKAASAYEAELRRVNNSILAMGEK